MARPVSTFIALALALVSVLSGVVDARTFTVTNSCPYTIWPALFTDLHAGNAVPQQATGWEAAPHTSVSFHVPDNWVAGRIWGRRNCDFRTNPGANSCLDGGCNGGLLCDPHTGTGVPPATVAEFTLSSDPNAADNYDVSLVDGYNLPMRVTNNVGCHIADCPVDLAPNCPAKLKGPFDSKGNPVGCRSACQAGLSPDPANSPYCCTGSHNTAATCPPSGVLDYHYFKDNCPNAYAYAYDESSGTALWTCPSHLKADFTIQFCP
ncbi:thaumatin-like protein [Stereum hirsutum FP-91666 SS1]|uniref:thaumatin-like protein n=1 Tax=Stereum hirsutum (strain FP-91666) TaxID=721885 RepID=UPI000444A0CB|nr:thaumatin-like protein [Stereum hirsutum FP-91666 SS1]EIM80662.1 thaumatin-like protein [Stereum hirsutum FP-91666 SS1]